MPRIKFVKEKKEIEVPAGTNLRQAMLDNKVPVYSGIHQVLNCGGRGTCGSCRVHVKEGEQNLSGKTFLERLRMALAFFPIGHESEVRLSCQAKVQGDVTVEATPAMNWYGEEVKYTVRSVE